MKTTTFITTCLMIVIALTTQQPAMAQDTSAVVLVPEEWVSLGTYDTSTVEYDLQSLRWLDSEHISVYIKMTPVTPIRKQLLQESTGRLHPVSFYNGYEYYGYTVREETIDLRHRQSSIVNSWDYDISDGLLEWIRTPQAPQSVAAICPESALIKEVMSVITRVVIAKAQL